MRNEVVRYDFDSAKSPGSAPRTQRFCKSYVIGHIKSSLLRNKALLEAKKSTDKDWAIERAKNVINEFAGVDGVKDIETLHADLVGK